MNDATTTAQELSGRFLWGELTGLVLGEIKRFQIPWGALPEKEQRETIQRIGDRLREVTKQAVDIIVGQNRPTVLAEVESVTFKDGIKIVLTLSKRQADRHAIADATGQGALLVLPMYDELLDGDAPKPEPDQKRLDGLEEAT